MKLTKNLLLLAFVQLGVFQFAFSQNIKIEKIHPTNWWVGMKNPNLQILFYGKDISKNILSLKPYSGVKLKKVQKTDNPNYLFADLEISKTTKAGKLEFTLAGTPIYYELKKRTTIPQGVNTSDFIYLIMPDRFVNGDPSNDKFDDLNDKDADKNNPFLRHGGDFKGIADNFDYLKNLGVTALWLTPVIENNTFLTNEGGTMRSSYHGYHFTDFYQIDKRFGGNEGYKKFINDAHAKDLKIVQDAVYNHIGPTTWFFKDLPTKDWIHNWDSYTNTTYKEQSILDIHGSAIDKKTMLDGWFTAFLPDLNQKNPLLATYLIQNAIWQTETYNLDAWRIDTYMYNDLDFMNRCNQALMDEFPTIHLIGESAVKHVVNQAYFVKNNLNIPFKCNLPGTLDFVYMHNVLAALNENFGWDEGVSRIYTALSQDLVYQDPNKNVTFLENHDTDRFFSVVGEDFNKYKMGITWLLTHRGIPHFYYGTEVLMKNFKNPSDAEVRQDFPISKLAAQGRTEKENEAFNFVSKLANFRKSSDAIINGKMMQFTPVDGVYVYFRYSDKQKLMIVSNTNKVEKELKTERFNEIINTAKQGKNILTGEVHDILNLKINPMTAIVLEIK